jgi:hypothetical protein
MWQVLKSRKQRFMQGLLQFPLDQRQSHRELGQDVCRRLDVMFRRIPLPHRIGRDDDQTQLFEYVVVISLRRKSSRTSVSNSKTLVDQNLQEYHTLASIPCTGIPNSFVT